MKRTMTAFLAGTVLASAGLAGAAATRYVTLKPNDHATYAGADCKATDLGSASGRWLTCVSSSRYSVIYSPRKVSVFKGDKIVFSRSR